MTSPKLADLALWGDANAFHEGRAYIDPRDPKGRRYPSITTILKLVDKSSLTQWAVNLAVAYCVDNWQRLGQQSDEAANRGAKYRWKDFRDERAEVGDGVHNYIENLQKGLWTLPELDTEQSAILDQFLSLTAAHDVVPLRNEVTVGDLDAGWMGTFDSYCKLDGKRTMVDFKTSKNVYDEHRMQLAALSNAKEWFIETGDMVWEVIPPEPIERVAIFHLRDDHWEIVPIENIDLHYKKFQEYTKIWYLNEELKKIQKED